jgi:hypothetical protein
MVRRARLLAFVLVLAALAVAALACDERRHRERYPGGEPRSGPQWDADGGGPPGSGGGGGEEGGAPAPAPTITAAPGDIQI